MRGRTQVRRFAWGRDHLAELGQRSAAAGRGEPLWGSSGAYVSCGFTYGSVSVGPKVKGEFA